MMTFLSIVVLISAIVTIYAKTREKNRLQYIFKPLTMATIILSVILNISSSPSLYQTMIFVGLIFSMIGDIFLINQKRFFIFGLISFLLGHLCYSAAFLTNSIYLNAAYNLVFAAVVYLIYCGILLKILWRNLNRLKIPVIVYSVVLVTMSWLALGVYFSNPILPALDAFVGSVFFVASDSILAFNKFKKPIPLAASWILGTYFLAQWLIAHSIGFF